MRRPSIRFFTRLATCLSLAWALAPEVSAQTRTAQIYDPSIADPQYDMRKMRLVGAHPNVPQVIAPHGRGTAAPTVLPSCFEPIDTTAAGGYTNLPPNDDGSTGAISLPFTFTLFGTPYTQAYVNNNGNISFDQPYSTFTSTGFPVSGIPMVAAFWADVDTRGPGSGTVWYKVFPDRMVVTWNRVGYYNSATDKKNTFQIIIRANTASVVTDDVTFSYGDMQWTTGSASSGSGGFGGTPATVGANRGINGDYIQTGRFNLNDSSHPDNVNPSGVNWLDNQCINYRVFNNGNLPPVANNMPAGNTINVNQGQTVSIAPQFSGPEVGQSVTLTVDTHGLCNAPYTVTPGVNPVLNLSVTGSPCNAGTHVIDVTATDNGTPAASAQFSITVNVTPPPGANGQWTGNVSTAYSDAANWSNNVLPTATTDVIIPATAVRMPLLTSAASANNFTVNSGATLTIGTGGTLTLTGTMLANGTTTGTGTLNLSGNALQNLGGSSAVTMGNLTVGPAGAQLTGPVAVRQMLTLNGNLATNSQPLTLLSDASGTAMVVHNGNATVTGNATVQRYISPNLNGGAGYRHYATPVQLNTFADLATTGFSPVFNSNYNTAPVPANVTPFPNVFGYDEARVNTSTPGSFDKGWYSPNNASEFMTPGQGYTVNINAASTVDFVGTLINGPIQRTNLTRGSQAESGWHLVGNPYAAPLDWSLMSGGLSGMDNAAYVYKSSGTYAGNYVSVVNGVGPERFIPVAQGFFVRTSAPGTPGTISFSTNARATSYVNPTFNRTQEVRPLVQLDLVGASMRDAAYLYFEQGATAGFDSRYDAYKLKGGSQFQVALLAGAELLSIDGRPALSGADVAVPLRVQVPTTGTYTFEAAQVLNLPTGYTAYLQDALTGASINLSQQASYSFSMDASFDGPRFTLLVSQNRVLATANSQLNNAVQLYPNPAHAAAQVLLPAAMTKAPVAATLLNALGQAVRSYTLPAGVVGQSHTLELRDVAAGVYTLRLTSPAGIATKRLVVE